MYHFQIGDIVTFFYGLKEGKFNGDYKRDIRLLSEENIEIIVDAEFIKGMSSKVHLYSLFRSHENKHIIEILEQNGIVDWTGNFENIFIKKDAIVGEDFKVDDKLRMPFEFSSDIDIEKIKEEMIDKVDKNRFIQLLSIAGSSDENRNRADKDVTNRYLSDWANSKWKLYVLFGNNLTISKEVKYRITEDLMKGKIREFAHIYPKCAELIQRIDTTDFINNEMRTYSFYNSDVYTSLTPGIKVTKFIHNLYEDKVIDSALSLLLENREVNSNVYISIDPYDYCTMSTNKNGWQSCHRITDGEYAGGGLSYMLDNNSCIAYSASEAEFNYNLFGFKFKGNSKNWRQLVNIDTSSFAAVFGRQYPNSDGIDCFASAVRTLYEDTVDSFIGNFTNWRVKSNGIVGKFTTDNNRFAYYDVQHGYNYKFVYLPKCFANPALNIEVGRKTLYDVYNGNTIHTIGSGRRIIERID